MEAFLEKTGIRYEANKISRLNLKTPIRATCFG